LAAKNSQDNKKEGEEKDGKTTAFFILPAEALVTLRHELSPLADDPVIRAIIFRYGFRSGEACIQTMDIKSGEFEKPSEILPELWEEIGLGKLILEKDKEDGIHLKLTQSIEGDVMGESKIPSCDFTRGYLAGTISHLSGNMYHCKEKKCVSKGDSHCTFLLTQRGES
jgi:predicted hydrocarbon binding protein